MRSDTTYGSECADFTIGNLRRVRGLVDQAGYRSGLSLPDTDNLITAVSEIVTNAVAHAGGTGSITVAQSPNGVHVEIQDAGPGLPAEFDWRRPSPELPGGRGLWLARRLCRRFTIASSPGGVTVWMFMPVGAAVAKR